MKLAAELFKCGQTHFELDCCYFNGQVIVGLELLERDFVWYSPLFGVGGVPQGAAHTRWDAHKVGCVPLLNGVHVAVEAWWLGLPQGQQVAMVPGDYYDWAQVL